MAETESDAIVLLKALQETTIKMKEKLGKGEIEEFYSFLSRRQEIIEELDKIGSIQDKEALSLLLEINDLSQEMQKNLSQVMEKELQNIKNMQESLHALRHFRSNLQPPSPPRFLDQKR